MHPWGKKVWDAQSTSVVIIIFFKYIEDKHEKKKIRKGEREIDKENKANTKP